jgi:plastocyanin
MTKEAKKEIFVGKVISGPKKIVYEFDAPAKPGKYFFRCDIHPKSMVGTFVVK